MRTNLQVPFAEKDDAKRLGARWDPARKVWYVENKADLSPFARWLPSPGAAVAGNATAAKSSAAKTSAAAGTLIVGSRFVETPRFCDCLAWEVCDKCRATALDN